MSIRIVIVTVLCIIMLSCAFLSLYFLQTKPQLMYKPMEISSVNFNNYHLKSNLLDYKGDSFAVLRDRMFDRELIVVDSSGKQISLKGITSPFQLSETFVAYIDNGTLKVCNITTKDKETICNNVKKFVLKGNNLYYITNNNHESGELYQHELSSNKTITIYKDVRDFYINKDKLYLIDSDDKLIEALFNDIYSTRFITQLSFESFPYVIMTTSNRFILNDAHKGFCFLNLETLESEYLSVVDNAKSNDFAYYVCNDSVLYYSYHKSETDGSIVKKVDSENNGLWAIDITTLNKKKLSSEIYDELYLFDNILFGVNGKKVFQIDINSGESNLVFG